jgi:hypothetical protein
MPTYKQVIFRFAKHMNESMAMVDPDLLRPKDEVTTWAWYILWVINDVQQTVCQEKRKGSPVLALVLDVVATCTVLTRQRKR